MTPRFIVHTIKARPRLFAAIAMALFIGFALPHDIASHATTRFLLAWNVGTCAYLAMAVHMTLRSTQEGMRRRARLQSESRLVTMALVILAVFAGLAAIFAQLAAVKDMHGALKAAHIGLACLTILSSWAFTHTMFALHYAHDYYGAVSHKQPGGMEFPGTPDPEYGDFFYAAFIIGTSGQTADVTFTSKPMRRVALVHSVLAFLFNTTVLAMTINMAAGFL